MSDEERQQPLSEEPLPQQDEEANQQEASFQKMPLAAPQTDAANEGAYPAGGEKHVASLPEDALPPASWLEGETVFVTPPPADAVPASEGEGGGASPTTEEPASVAEVLDEALTAVSAADEAAQTETVGPSEPAEARQEVSLPPAEPQETLPPEVITAAEAGRTLIVATTEADEAFPARENVPEAHASVSPPPPLDVPPEVTHVPLDEHGFPIAAESGNEPALGTVPPTTSQFQAPAYQTPSEPPSPPRPPFWRRSLGCALRAFLVLAFFLIVAGAGLAAFGVYKYYSIASTLPDVDDLKARAAHFETTRILDRNGDVLYEILDPNAGRRTYVTLAQISPYMVAATLATEDKNFYEHPGVDIWAIARAFWQNYTTGEVVSGASTITQQLARALLLSPDERGQRTYRRKLREAILAMEITRRYSKDEILELYLNEIYYGNLAYGVEAAAETYFHTTADKLTLAQAAFLAGLPQAPAVYDPYTNRDVAMQRYRQVLGLLYQTSQEQGCIQVSNSVHPICVTAADVQQALAEMEAYDFPPPEVPIRFPHWVNYIRSLLEERYDPQTIYRSGFTVYTTLDPNLQTRAQEIVQQQVHALSAKHVTDGALVAIRPTTGEILAMVGSADFYNEAIHGQVNMALAPRQPGSSIKPLTYVAAFEKGWTPATLIWDVPSEFPPSGNPNDPRPPYKPVNYDGRFHGPVTVRTALANSYNIPAVKTLQFVGIYDDPNTPQKDGLVGMAERLGITTLTRDDYGLSLTLGGGEVKLLELTGAYAVFANGGKRVPPVAITRIVDYQGNTVYEYTPPPGEQVLRPEHAYLITSILSDNQARAPEFGLHSVLNLPFPAAAKTGTTNDFRDNWTMGYTPDLAVGVWVGNADNSPMVNSSGLTGAAPIWAQFMQYAENYLTHGNPTPFNRPAGIVEYTICAVSGAEPSKWCPKTRTEIFAYDQPPLPASDDLWKLANIDTWTQLEQSDACNPDGLFAAQWLTANVSDPWARKWLRKSKDGRAWAAKMGFKNPVIFTPDRKCTKSDPRPIIEFVYPRDGTVITSENVDFIVQADATKNFKDFRIDVWRPERKKWIGIFKSTSPFPNPDKALTWQVLDFWDWAQLPQEAVKIRIYMHSTKGDLNYAIREIKVTFQLPTPTPTPTPTATPTPTPLSTATPTPIPTLLPTPTPTP